MEIFPMHVLFLLVLVGVAVVAVLSLVYRHGRKIGDQIGYIRGYKDGQQLK